MNREFGPLKEKSRSTLRSVTRLYAVQSLYRAQFEGESLDAIEKESSPEICVSEEISLQKMDEEFFKELITRLRNNLDEINRQIAANITKNWSFERLDKVMQSLLQLGVCELLFFKEVPQNVVFNEYIELAKAFFEKKEVSFVNGLLNSVAKKSDVKSEESNSEK